MQTFGNDGNGAGDDQTGIGIRYQHPIAPVDPPTDAMVGFRKNEDDLLGTRFEIRRKF